jgi:quercetin dioxygenase-like cupin family protein
MPRALRSFGRGVGAWLVACALAIPALASQASAQAGPEMALHRPDTVQWSDGPPSLPAGAQFAVLEGDPGEEGFFLMRVRVPDGYRIPPHWHPKTERITVIRGTFHLGMGERFDADAAEVLPAESYGYWEAGMRHFAFASGETVVQIHGVGPWQIHYVDPADDPRNADAP